jgi:hypothetical protein
LSVRRIVTGPRSASSSRTLLSQNPAQAQPPTLGARTPLHDTPIKFHYGPQGSREGLLLFGGCLSPGSGPSLRHRQASSALYPPMRKRLRRTKLPTDEAAQSLMARTDLAQMEPKGRFPRSIAGRIGCWQKGDGQSRQWQRPSRAAWLPLHDAAESARAKPRGEALRALCEPPRRVSDRSRGVQPHRREPARGARRRSASTPSRPRFSPYRAPRRRRTGAMRLGVPRGLLRRSQARITLSALD